MTTDEIIEGVIKSKIEMLKGTPMLIRAETCEELYKEWRDLRDERKRVLKELLILADTGRG